MVEKGYQLILVGNSQVGLIGLKVIFEELKDRRGEPESVLKEVLVEKAGKKNCIAPSVRENYKRTLLREFKIFLGEDVEEEERGGFLEVTIWAQGTPNANRRKICQRNDRRYK